MTRSTRSRDLIARLIWQIEHDLAEGPTLASLAAATGLSRFHITRAFSLATGTPLMAYVRARRLSEAALALAEGRESVTGAAFLAGYGSAEGFSRAFRAQFGCDPSTVRGSTDLTHLSLQEILTMTTPPTDLPRPEIIERPAQTVAGRAGRYTMETRMRIPALWDTAIADIALDPVGEAFGVCYDFDEDGSFRYLAGVAADRVVDPGGLDTVMVPAARYARFAHAGHISTISETWEAIFASWAPQAAFAIAAGPEFEVYAPDFDPTRPGGVAICIPVEPRG